MNATTPATAALEHVTVVREGRAILDDVSWTVRPGERWVVLGANGSGKTTLLSILGAQLHPSTGVVTVLGHPFGRTDLRSLRMRIGMTSGAVTRELRPGITVEELVLTGRRSALETWWHDYNDEDRAAVEHQLAAHSLLALRQQPFAVISEGERQRALLARALVNTPGLLLLDEPFAGLDLGARERLRRHLSALFASDALPAAVLVTHHVEEIPANATHALLLRNGAVVASGSLERTLTSTNVSMAFDLSIEVRHKNNRWSIA